MIDRLDSIQFSGHITIESHVGDFCYVLNPAGESTLAPDGLPAAQCDQVGMSFVDADKLGSQQSIAFANLLATVAASTDGRISASVRSMANARPVAAYPSNSLDLTAGDWNDAAARNNRVVVSLEPRDP